MTSGVLTDTEPTGESSEPKEVIDLRAPAPVPGRAVPDIVRRRLARPGWPDMYFWIVAMGVTLVGFALRYINLPHPPEKIFDELYYADEAQDLLRKSVEWNWDDNTPQYVVHPPLGKWMIGAGESIFGYNSFGWRISACVIGTLSILLVVLIAQRLFRSTVLSACAGLLMSMDGMHFVLSRSALLDIFLMFFIVLSFFFLVLDREDRRARWLRFMESGGDPGREGKRGRPPFSVPWWRLASGLSIGLACGVKWSGLWFIFVFVALAGLWEVRTRRSAGVKRPWRDTFLDESVWLVAFVAVAVIAYTSTWFGWFATDDGYFRHWYADTYHVERGGIKDALLSLMHYHEEAYAFHTGLTTRHQYQSWPWQWLLLARPVAFYWNTDGPCGAGNCAAEILLLGTPLLWWSFIPALAGLGWVGIARRDWRAAALGLCVFAGIVPWFWSELSDRTMFYFYALPAEPFLVLTVVYVLGAILGPPKRLAPPDSDRRIIGAVIVGTYMLLVALCFAYFYPIYAGDSIPYTDWFSRMWLGGRWV
jgi:dolichyl-phosphate-mannose-protein mannosyltransferase